MSWIVQSLLRNKDEIKTKADIDSDDYNNILLIEKAITDLVKIGAINEREERLLSLISDGSSYEELEEEYHLNRKAISTHFITLCDRLALYMGDEFTDEGYLEYMVDKYNLDQTQRETLQNFMKGKFKHKTIRKINNDK